MYNHEPYILFSIIYIRNAVYVRKKENNFNSFHLEATQKKNKKTRGYTLCITKRLDSFGVIY